MSEQTSTGQFDPAAHNVEQVNAYLEQHPDEVERVLAAEATGKGRQGVLQGPHAAQEPQEPQEGAEGPETGTDEPQEGIPGDTSTKGATFAEAVEVIAAHDGPATPVHVTSTDVLAAEGKSKGLTFAEQAALAREQYGKGNPADRTEG